MKSITTVSLMLAIAVSTGKSNACEPILHDARSDFPIAESILVGYVTGNIHTAYEKHLISGGNPNTGQVGDVLVRVAPTEALKGTKPTNIIEVVSDCMGTSPNVGTKVVVIRLNNRNYLVEYSGYLGELRQVMQHGR